MTPANMPAEQSMAVAAIIGMALLLLALAVIAGWLGTAPVASALGRGR